MTELSRIVLDFRTGELVCRVLYRSDGQPNPGTVRRRREVTDLARAGLRQALAALDSEASDVSVVGVSGFTTREDILSISSPSAVMSTTRVKGS